MTVINTNMKSLIAANALKVNNRAMSHAMEQLSTGSRINSASDDAAGLAVSQSMTAQIRGLNMAVRNANDGISLAQTAEGSMVEISNMLQRMRELAVQSATGTLSTPQQGYLDSEFQALSEQIGKVITNTTWNDIALLSDSADVKVTIQAGADSGQGIDVTVAKLDLTKAATLGEITDSTKAGLAIDAVDLALDQVNSARASLGASVNQLTSAADNMTNISQNLSESRSRILDTDYAQATTELASTMIIQQAGAAVLAQANQSSQSVLALLR